MNTTSDSPNSSIKGQKGKANPPTESSNKEDDSKTPKKEQVEKEVKSSLKKPESPKPVHEKKEEPALDESTKSHKSVTFN